MVYTKCMIVLYNIEGFNKLLEQVCCLVLTKLFCDELFWSFEISTDKSFTVYFALDSIYLKKTPLF